jgi:hypothetical protein
MLTFHAVPTDFKHKISKATKNSSRIDSFPEKSELSLPSFSSLSFVPTNSKHNRTAAAKQVIAVFDAP